MTLSRRMFALGALALPGCSSLGLLGPSGPVRDLYELQPVALPAQSARASRRLMVLLPTAPAGITSDRILIRPDAITVAYLPGAAWSDSVPLMLQSAIVRTVASAGRLGFVGAQGAGPVPDTVLLTRIDAFEVSVQDGGGFAIRVAFEMTVLRDRDQRVLGTRRFEGSQNITSDRADLVAQSFQRILDASLPQAGQWILGLAG